MIISTCLLLISSTMTYFLVGMVLLVGFFVYQYFIKKWGPRPIDIIKESWGKVKKEEPYFDKIGIYWRFKKEIPFFELNDQTAQDMDFKELFSFVDRTSSRPGQQFLFNILRRPTNKIEILEDRNKKAAFFKENWEIRESVQMALLELNSFDSYYIPTLLIGRLREREAWFPLFYLDLILLFLLPLLAIKWHLFLLVALALLAFNGFYFLLYNKEYTFQLSNSLLQLYILTEVCKKIAKMNIPFEKAVVLQNAISLKNLQKKIRLINFGFDGNDQTDLGNILVYFSELIKAIFLIDTFVLEGLVKDIQNNKGIILSLYEFIGEVDVSISIASLQSGELAYCTPTLLEGGKTLKVRNLKHPLISSCVGNDLEVHGKSVLITGSNMSGKSSFLRTLLVNTLLSQTLFTCFSDEYEAPFFQLLSSIRIDDNLFEGKSYYMAEVDVIGELVSKVISPFQNLYILDEVFKGTNTLERIAAGKAILSYLNKNNHMVFVATHDLELSDMLKSAYDLYHFTEDIHSNALLFDHRLKKGPLKTTNALKILEIANFPQEIIQEAQKIRRINSGS